MITVEHTGLDHAVLRINKFAQIDRYALLAIMAETVRKQTVERFGTKQSPDGGAWAPRKASSRGGGYGLMTRTGALRNSITAKVSGSTAEVSTNIFYAKFHQFGTRKMVARPFMGLNAQNISELRRIAEAFVGAAAS